MITRLAVMLLITGVSLAAGQETKVADSSAKGDEKMAFTLTSSAFGEGEMIPTQYTCDGKDISPPLSWSNAPEETKSFALIADDPDAPKGTWVHWVVYNMKPDTDKLEENVPKKDTLDGGTVQGTTDFKKPGYGGPCPPSGTHRYFFKLYALDTTLNLEGSVTKADLLKAMDGHILAETQLMGKYSRKK